MPNVRLHLLGGFELTIDGFRTGSLQPSAQRLLAFIALTPRGVERDFAALQLWPDTTEERARANLRSSLWRIRRLPVALIETSPSRLRLADNVWLDARDGLGDLLEGADDGPDGPLPFQILLTDLLPDWYDDWLMIEREKMRQYTLRALESRARAALDGGRAAEAIQVALTAMAIDPLRETSCRLVIEAHLSEGNDYEARRTVEGYQQRLRCDAQMELSADLAAVLDGASEPVSVAHLRPHALGHRVGDRRQRWGGAPTAALGR